MYIMKIIPRKNMKFSHYVKSYLIFIRLRIRFLKLFRSTYKNYLSTINHVLRKKYPFDGILKNGKICRYNQYSEVYYALLNLDYNNEEDCITVSVKNSPKKINQSKDLSNTSDYSNSNSKIKIKEKKKIFAPKNTKKENTKYKKIISSSESSTTTSNTNSIETSESSE